MTTIPSAVSPKSPRPHQQEALDDALAGLRDGGRGQVIMACGTGKTLVGQRAAEALTPDDGTVLVLFPSLALLDQTVREWQANTTRPFSALAVCSEEKIGRGDAADGSGVHVSDIPITVTTDSSRVASWLRATSGCRVVFATYQSTPVIEAAHAETDVPGWDLVVADEAHRMAGPNDGAFATALHDTKIPAVRRLFLTATPRIHAPSKKDDDASAVVMSMDDAALFGPVLHRLTFADAIQQNLLSDYRVAIVGVTNTEVHQFLLDNPSLGDLDGSAVAAQIATALAVKEYGLRSVIGFHNRLSRSRAFANTLHGAVAGIPRNRRPRGKAVAWHVDGATAPKERRKALSSLGAAHEGPGWVIVNNVRCLTEGIDVPTLDGILIAEPRTSPVEIAQAVGRAIRLHPARSTPAILLLPVYLADGENPESVLDDSEFRHIYQTLQALQDHDTEFQATFKAARETQGEGGDDSETTVKERIDLLLPSGAPEGLHHALAVRLIERTTSTWNEGLGALRAYRHRWGHTQVPQEYITENGLKLGWWLTRQRRRYRRGVLASDRVKALEGLGVSWEPRRIVLTGREMEALTGYVAENGHARVPQSYVTRDGVKLGQWVHGLRRRRKTGSMSDAEAADLDALGFVWDATEVLNNAAGTRTTIETFRTFVSTFGHGNVPGTYVTPEGAALGRWTSKQRQRRANGTLSARRIAELDALGFVWDSDATAARTAAPSVLEGNRRRAERQYQRGLAALGRYVNRNGHADVPHGYVTDEGLRLGAWLTSRRYERRLGVLSADRISDLEALAVRWGPAGGRRNESSWDGWLDALRAFREEHGHVRVNQTYVSVNGKKLGSWVKEIRKQYRAGRLAPDRIEQLDALGFVWEIRRARGR